MPKKKKTQARLKTVTLKLPWMSVTWDSDEKELKALRDLLNEVQTRRAFEVNRGMIKEQPVYFLDSILQMRDRTRKLVNTLQLDAKETRLIMLTVMDWLSEILDDWNRSMIYVNSESWDFRRFNPHDMMDVMDKSWNVIEDVRKRFDLLVKDLEKQLKQ